MQGMPPIMIMEAIEAAVERRRPPRFAKLGCVLMGLFAFGCATKKSVSFEDFNGSQRAIEVMEGGPLSEQRSYILADDEFVLEVREPHDLGAGAFRFDLGRLETRTLDPAVAEMAWRRIEKLGVSSWRRSYSAGETGAAAPEGLDWSIDVRVGDMSRRSGGSCAYPGLPNPAGTVTGGDANSYAVLKFILEPLGR
jgi:hypothetical protein